MTINLKNRNFLKLLDYTPAEIRVPDRPRHRAQGLQKSRAREANPAREKHRPDL